MAALSGRSRGLARRLYNSWQLGFYVGPMALLSDGRVAARGTILA